MILNSIGRSRSCPAPDADRGAPPARRRGGQGRSCAWRPDRRHGGAPINGWVARLETHGPSGLLEAGLGQSLAEARLNLRYWQFPEEVCEVDEVWAWG